jgi:uncharacterized protein (TIGR02246 family)
MHVLRVNAKIAVVLFCMPWAATSARAEDVARQIEEANSQFAEAFAKGEADRIADLYVEEGKLLPPNSEVVSGRKEIRAFWSKAMESGVKAVTLKSSEVGAHGDTALEMGNYTLFGKDAKEIDRGKYLVVWKRDHGRWRLYRDCWNSSKPSGKSGGGA